jgi:transposase InsO family protein/transposase-like protein
MSNSSKRRLVITAVLAGSSQSEVARTYAVSQGWISRLMKRYEAEGEATFEPRSRAPKNSPTATPPATVELVLRLRKELSEAGLDAGADTIDWHLDHHHQITLARATINRILARHGLITPEPKKKPKSSYVRFEAEQPNETWQSDFTHYRLTRTDGRPSADVEIISWLDDHSRYALHVSAHARVTAPIVLTTFTQAADLHRYPASTLTDNGMVYTVRLAGHGRQGGKNSFEAELSRRHIVQKNSRPNHPTTCGKAERFQQTMKKWLRAQPLQPSTLADLETLLNQFCDEYNHRRPHRSLPHHAPRPPPTRPARRPPPAPTRTTKPTTGSATTRSARPAPSPCGWPANCATSASAEPTPEPTSSCSSRTSPSESSTPPPANSSASSPSTHAATTSPPADHPDPPKRTSPDLRNVGPGYSDVLRHHIVAGAGFEPATSGL